MPDNQPTAAADSHRGGPGAPAQGFSSDAGERAQRVAEEHLVAVWEAHHAEEGCEDGVGGVESPASAPFDGCDTCQVRETLYAGWPVLEADTIGRLRAAGFTDAADFLTHG